MTDDKTGYAYDAPREKPAMRWKPIVAGVLCSIPLWALIWWAL